MPPWPERDVRFMRELAELLADELEREERARHAWLMAAAAGNVQALLAGLTARDGYTGAHSQAVVDLALAIGRRLELEEILLGNLHWTAVLHDIGKLGVAEEILRKPGKLTDVERLEMRRHAEIGERIIAATPELAHLARSIRAEHERWDGAGYPDGLMGEEIPLSSRIVFVSDAYHAMISERPYRAARTVADARRELERNAGSQFCPTVVAAALAVLTERSP
jgi:HD-GYP domain-containing protein (c-di-GMP phosphodiesterase class II)